MLSFRKLAKLKIPRRLRSWGSRGQVQPGILRSMDPEVGRGVGVAVEMSPRARLLPGNKDPWEWTRGGGYTDEVISSQSEPILPGPYSNPEDFRLIVPGDGGVRHGDSLRKTVSLGAVVIVPRENDRTDRGDGEEEAGESNEAGPSNRGREKGIGKCGGDKKNEQAGPSQAQDAKAGPSRDRSDQDAVSGGTGSSADAKSRRASGDGASVTDGGGPENNQVVLEDPIAPPLPGARPDHIAIDMIDEGDNPMYLHAYFDTMYYFGISPYKTEGMRGRETDDWFTWLVNMFQLCVVCSIVFWSIWESFNQGKYNVLQFMSGEGLSYFVDFAFHFFCFQTKVYSVYLLTWRSGDVDDMLQRIHAYGNQYGSKSPCHCSHWKWIIFGICVGTLVMSFVDTLFERGIEDWSPQQMIREKSFDVSVDLLLWKYDNFSERSRSLYTDYGRQVTGTTIAFGAIGVVTKFTSDFQMGILRDLVLIMVLVIFFFVMNFVKGIHDTMENVPATEVEAHAALQARREELWQQFQMLKGVIIAANLVFQFLLLFLHVANLLLYGFFSILCIEREDYGASVYVHYAFNIVKAEITYLIAGRISAQNKILRQWVGNWACHTGKIVLNEEEYDASILLNQLDTDPMAIGSGIFQIDEAFHCKFIAMMSSLVLFLADQKKKEQAPCVCVCK